LQGSSGGGGSQSSANSASRGGGGRNSGSHGRGGHGQSGRGRDTGGRGRGAPNSGGQKQCFNGQCQVCLKEGHNTASCWHRFDADYVLDEKLANTVVHRYGVDSNWYTDTGATDHITSELDKLVIHDKYNGNDQIRTASGAGMNINHVGKAIISTPNCNLYLNNVLHVPNAKKNLVSVHRVAADNNAFLEFHPNFFLLRIRP
jgi:histone deacetylase 1/2